MTTTLHNPARTWVDNTGTPPAGGDSLTAALLNQELRDNFNFLQAPPYCSLRKSAGMPLTIVNNTWTLLTWDVEDDDADAMHDLVTNPSRITVPVAGVYRVTCSSYWAGNSAGFRGIIVTKNGVNTRYDESDTAINDVRQNARFDIRCAASDYLEMLVYQNTGVNIALQTDGAAPFFQARWVRV